MMQDPEKTFRQWARTNDPSPTISDPNVGGAERLLSSAAGGALLVAGLQRRSSASLLLGALGGYLVYRGVTGHCELYKALGMTTSAQPSTRRGARRPYAVSQHQGIHVEESVTINRSAEDLYDFWRHFENLPQFMSHLEAVKTLPNGTSHWRAKGPAGLDVTWDAEIVGDKRGELISWRSLPHSTVANAGAVRFEEAAGGTKVAVKLTYNPPAGRLGAAVARLFGEAPSLQIRDDLNRLKISMEDKGPGKVTEASEESFPASDAPSFTGTTAAENE